MNWKKSSYFSFLLIVAALSGCPPDTAVFNQRAYEQAVSLKVDALSLMDKAVSSYASCRPQVEAFKLEFQKAYEYVKGLPHNDETVKQYDILADSSKNSLFGFLALWESDGTLSPPFIKDAKGLVSDGFDMVIGLESGKVKE